ncbi:DUF1579 family protein [Sinimarinibacterium flocculans]|uniref:Uncharacterized protein DUF1579 n=1 Tax=Sinimarinibacterium flocculans TaxID=985250 RepID=A0A318E7Z2_9GAMM|nr:DUF1579 family protein [Sinimarinibacterium flocculans]PXV66533.1 uncharacterized protein DUF1579 [Sinimarinibacterium flocculans]
MSLIRSAVMAIVAVVAASGGVARASGPCSTPEHRQFDFWIGEWRVLTPDGVVAGINRIESLHGGCVIRERYATGRGYSGESLNTYDATRKVWHQTWTDSAGLLLLLEGGFDGDSMVLEGNRTAADGRIERQRITWTPNEDGTVRQHWQVAPPDGEWTTAFDGLYTRQAATPAP